MFLESDHYVGYVISIGSFVQELTHFNCFRVFVGINKLQKLTAHFTIAAVVFPGEATHLHVICIDCLTTLGRIANQG